MENRQDNKIQVVSEKKERLFFRVYLDMWDTGLLSADEKLVFLALKRHADIKEGDGEVFPSLEKICDEVGRSKKTVIKHLHSLQKKGIIDIKRRGLTKSNLYTIRDREEMWKARDVSELQRIAGETDLEKAIRTVKEAGGTIIFPDKEKRPASDTDQSSEASQGIDKNFTGNNYNKMREENQYSLDEIKEKYDYNTLCFTYAADIYTLDAIIKIAADMVNCRQENIWIGKEKRNTGQVREALLNLSMYEIEYVLKQFKSRTYRIENPAAYIRTLLYESKEQAALALTNELSVNHDNNIV